MKNKSKTIIIAVIAFLVIVVGIGFWYWQKEPSVPVSSEHAVDQKTADISLGSQILQRTQNLLQDRFPETNPFKKIIKNPF